VSAPSTPILGIPRDESTDLTCRITITSFFSFKKGYDVQAFRDLFVPASQYLVDDSLINSREEAPILLELLPASQWWETQYPKTPIPGQVLPSARNEYVYYVKFTGHYTPFVTPVGPYPQEMLMFMEAKEQFECKIKGFGW